MRRNKIIMLVVLIISIIIATTTIVNAEDQTTPALNIEGKLTEWTKNDVTLTITATDDESGILSVTVNGTEIVIDDNGVGSYTATENGTYTIIATDNVGNITTNIITVSNIDRENPIIISSKDTEQETEKVTLTITAIDDKSGILSVTVDGTEIITDDDGVGSYIVTENGSYTIVATDNVGNITTNIITINNIKEDNDNKDDNNTTIKNTTVDNTISSASTLPNTGMTFYIGIVTTVIIITIIGIISYRKYKESSF